jgi:hypothetical protein
VKIVKPYGRSTVDLSRKRSVELYPAHNRKEGVTQPIGDFADQNPELLIAQWISVIDKIITKPKAGKHPTKDQYKARQELGDCCWALLKKRFPDDAQNGERLAELARIWQWKLHPYATDSPQKYFRVREGGSPPRIEGRWYKAFLGGKAYKEINDPELASKIEEHLHRSELAITGNSRESRMNKPTDYKVRGLVTSRARGIEKSVLKRIGKMANVPWSKDDTTAFSEKSDLAACIYSANQRIEADSKGRRKIGTAGAGELIAEHYGKHFALEGRVPSRREMRENHPGLLAIYDAVRAHYKIFLRNSKKKSFEHALPKNAGELIHLLERRQANRNMNALIRLGRIVHYESTPIGKDAPISRDAAIPSNNALGTSHYWTSEGQAEIKRSEAFVRVWRNTVSQAARTLATWIDPKGEWSTKDGRPSHVLDDEPSRAKLLDGSYDDNRAKEHAKLLLGSRAELFEACENYRAFLYLVLRLTAKCRNQVFHFRGRAAFVANVRSALKSPDFAGPPPSVQTVNDLFDRSCDLFEKDMAESKARTRKVCEGAKIGLFATQDQMNAYLALLDQDQESDAVLPKFNRMLRRLESTGQLGVLKDGSKIGRLPTPGKANDLENASLLAKYTACKLLYEGPFRSWLELASFDLVNSWIVEAVKEGTDRAQKNFSRDPYKDLMRAKADKIGRLAEGDKIASLFERLTADTASEMRVQNAYESVPEKARQQAAWIEAFRCDVVGKAFKNYLMECKIDWILQLGKESKPKDISADIEPPAAMASERPEQWLASLYLVLHMVPVDDVSRLLHQFRKWGVLQGKSEDKEAVKDIDVAGMRRVLSLYLKMHDAKHEGGAMELGLEPFKALYEKEADFRELFLTGEPGNDRLAGTRRGLREIMRFGHMGVLESITRKGMTISHVDVQAVLSMEAVPSGRASQIAQAQHRRRELHHKAIHQASCFNANDLCEYRKTVKEIEKHRHLAAQVRLTNQVKLHRLLMRVIARLVDYAGLWERDLYFATLGLMVLHGKRPEDIFEPGGGKSEFLKQGEVRLNGLKEEFKAMLPWYTQILKHGHWKIRNDFAHFNILADSALPVDLTAQINRTRELMSYDRKLKNAISKSVKELMFEEGFEMKWQVANHSLQPQTIGSRDMKHLPEIAKNAKEPPIIEKFHDGAFTGHVRQLFGNGSK